jgi:hypothetical protein
MLSTVDRSLLRAARVWRVAVDPEFWERLPADRRPALRAGWEEETATSIGQAREALLLEHQAQARPDLARVHVSWWVRALQEEPRSVQRAVASSLPEGVAEPLRNGLGLSTSDLAEGRPPHPGALSTVVSLWTERIVGDVAERDDDPPAIAALSRFDVPTTILLIRATGLVKWSMTSFPAPRLGRRERDRLEHFRERVPDFDRRFLLIAESDIAALDSDDPHPEARAGLGTFARLLGSADPYRVRWAIQHLPYHTAKTIRTLMGTLAKRTPMLVGWESELLFLSWKRLFDEGRVSVGWGVRT